MQLELGTDDDDRTARVVDALAEQVLAEAALLALQHVAERLQGRLLAGDDRGRGSPLSNSASTGLLEHALSLRMMISGARARAGASGGCCG